MSATVNYWALRVRCHLVNLTLLAAIGFAAAPVRAGQSPSNTPAQFLIFSSRVYAAAQRQFETEPTNNAAACEFARAAFDRGEYATNDTERASIAVQGIAACRQVLKRDAKCGPAHFYLGMNLGQLARTKMLGALPLVDEMETAFKTARQLDEHFNFAGPDRYLGQLYLEAPGWPTSVGSKSRARSHLQRAVILAPDYPENRINLAEAYLRWNEIAGARREMKALETSLPAARTNLTGEAWAASWADWETRLAGMGRKLRKSY
jgi:tetratricopeptide (TPR) repeat protein